LYRVIVFFLMTGTSKPSSLSALMRRWMVR
jgi:hypothetical protein